MSSLSAVSFPGGLSRTIGHACIQRRSGIGSVFWRSAFTGPYDRRHRLLVVTESASSVSSPIADAGRSVDRGTGTSQTRTALELPTVGARESRALGVIVESFGPEIDRRALLNVSLSPPASVIIGVVCQRTVSSRITEGGDNRGLKSPTDVDPSFSSGGPTLPTSVARQQSAVTRTRVAYACRRRQLCPVNGSDPAVRAPSPSTSCTDSSVNGDLARQYATTGS